MQKIDTPILFIIFNRPDVTQKVFNEIKRIKPKKLYVSADGPRIGNDEDIINCKMTREIIRDINWDCKLSTRFLKNNLGCGLAVSSSISWVFEKEASVIILEDDCLPSKSFFYYCQELLEKYKYSDKIWMISGNNYNEEFDFNNSYVFSAIGHHIWGWATWKRAWAKMDITKKYYYDIIKKTNIYDLYTDQKHGVFFDKLFSNFYNKDNVTHTWDYQWNFIISTNRGLTAVPRKNLVSNIGLLGIHTNSKHSFHNRKISENFHISNHPDEINQDLEYDQFHFNNHWKKVVIKPSLFRKVFLKIGKLLKIGK